MALKNYFIYNEFEVDKFQVIPKNSTTAYLQFFNNLACIFPILSNYICFYYIIKDSYKKPTPLNENLVLKEDLVNISIDGHRNKEIEDYLN